MSWHIRIKSAWLNQVPPHWTIKATEYNYGNGNIHRAVVLTDPTGWGHWRVQLMARPQIPSRPFIGDTWVDEHTQRVNHKPRYYTSADECLQDGLKLLPTIVSAMHPHQPDDAVPLELDTKQLDCLATGLKVAEDWYGPTHTNRCANPGCGDGDCRRAARWRRIRSTVYAHITASTDRDPMRLSYRDWLKACDGLDAARDWTHEQLHDHASSKQRIRCGSCRSAIGRIRRWHDLEDHLRQTLQGDALHLSPVGDAH